jgi:hypothetical protein
LQPETYQAAWTIIKVAKMIDRHVIAMASARRPLEIGREQRIGSLANEKTLDLQPEDENI